jgi:hypothetical protein
MDDIFIIIGKLYLELYQAQKMIEAQNSKIKDLSNNGASTSNAN